MRFTKPDWQPFTQTQKTTVKQPTIENQNTVDIDDRTWFERHYKGLAAVVIATFSITALAGYSATEIKTLYNRIQVYTPAMFDTTWNLVYSADTQTFTDQLTETNLKKLEEEMVTPVQKNQYQFAKTTYDLLVSTKSSATLDTLMTAVNTYTDTITDIDTTLFTTQTGQNSDLVAKVNQLVSDVNTVLDQVTVTNQTLSYDATTTTSLNLPTITTDLDWKDKDTFNKHITSLNKAVEEQIKENKDKATQQTIINIKSELETFISETNDYKTSIETNYIKGSDFKTLLNSLSAIDVASHTNWFTGLTAFDSSSIKVTTESHTSTTNTLAFSDRFFADNTALADYKAQLSKVAITNVVNTDIVTTTTPGNEDYAETYTYQLNTVANNISDNDLINKSSLGNISITIIHDQSATVVVTQASSTSSSSSSKTSSSSSSKTSSSSTTTRTESSQ